jgi:hypothetical protein
MPRKKKAPNNSERARNRLAKRLKVIRIEKFGDHGGPELARRLDIPAETWRNYETGVIVPAEVILRFIDVTAVDPRWLLFGLGDKYQTLAPGTAGDHAPKESASLVVDLLNKVSDRLEDGHLVINVSWKKLK